LSFLAAHKYRITIRPLISAPVVGLHHEGLLEYFIFCQSISWLVNLHVSDITSSVKNNSHVSSGEDIYLAFPFGPGIDRTIFLSLVLPVMKGDDDHLYLSICFWLEYILKNWKNLRQ
jgi:hypothetical protein